MHLLNFNITNMHFILNAVTLSGNSGEQFRGLLVQTRTVADDSRVGMFTVTDEANTRLSECTPANVSYMHALSALV